jgi:transposase
MRTPGGPAASESLVKECTRIVNRVKASLARLGIRGFRPALSQASKQLETLRTPEGSAVPANTLAEVRRDIARLLFVKQQIKEVERTRAKRLEQTHGERRTAMVRLLARVVGVGVESADLLVQEVFSRELRDRKAVARYAGLTGAPDESGQKRRERGLANAGNARVRRSMIELAWGHLLHQKDSPLAQWYRRRTADARGGMRKTMIVALARKFLITLWRLVTTGEAPAGLLLRPAA